MSSQQYSSSRLSGREHTSSPAPINCRQQQQAAYQAQQRTRDNVAYNVRLLEQEEVQQQAQQQAQLRGLQQQVVYQARQQQAQREAQKQRAVYRRRHSRPLPRRPPAAAAAAASPASAPPAASVAALDRPSDTGRLVGRTPDAGRRRQAPTQHLRRQSSHHAFSPQSLPAAQPDREASIRIGLLATALTEHTTCTDSWHTNWMLATALTDPDVGRSLSSLCTGSSEHTQQRVRIREHGTSERVPLGQLWV